MSSADCGSLAGFGTRHARPTGRLARALVWSRGQVVPLAVAAMVLLLLLSLRALAPGLAEHARHLVFDSYQRAAPRPYLPVPVRVVDIDDASLARLGQWPWPRRLVARLVDRLAEAGASAIALDVLFAEPDRLSPARLRHDLAKEPGLAPLLEASQGLPDYDAELARAVARAPVVTGFALDGRAMGDIAPPRQAAALAALGGDPAPFVPGFTGAVPSLPALEAAAAGNGSVSFVGGGDQTVRRVPLLQSLNGTLYPSLALEALRVAQGASTIKLRMRDEVSARAGGARPGIDRLRVGGFELPVDRAGQLWLHATGPAPGRSMPAWALLDAGPLPAEIVDRLRGNVVFVGTSAAGLRDLRATALDPFEAGVAIHAQLAEQALLGWFLSRPDWASGAEVIGAVLAGLGIALATATLGAGWGCMLAAGGAVAAVLAGRWAFSQGHLLLDPLPAVAALLLVYGAVAAAVYLRTDRDKRRIRGLFERYLDPALVDRLVAQPDRIKLDGELRELTFLFTDIAGFTGLVERTTPERLVALLNGYLDGVCRIVIEHGGAIDKIVGDAVHAIFNAPLDQPDHPQRAVDCALAIDAFATAFAAEQAQLGETFGVTRIGVNTGPAVVGSFGGALRFDYTAHGDAINTAARIEAANKLFGTRICVAGATAARCPGRCFRPVGEVLLRGKSRPTELLEPVPASEAGSERIVGYMAAFARLLGADPEAAGAFSELAALYPDDPLATFHARRTATGEVGTRLALAG